MAARARHRLADRGDRVELRGGDAQDTGLAHASVDAVFDFAIIHHIPDWRAAVAEVARVLRPGGRFSFEEVTRDALERPTYRTLFDHPGDDRFTADEFVADLEAIGLRVGERYRAYVGEDDVVGVAERIGGTLRSPRFRSRSNPELLTGPRSRVAVGAALRAGVRQQN